MINLIKKLYYEKYTKKSYSISNVDLIIDRMFSKVEKGVFIDLGCNHPIKFNNTYILYKRGWNGMNIDSSGIVKTDFYFYEITPVEYYNTPYVRRRDKLVGTVYLEKER